MAIALILSENLGIKVSLMELDLALREMNDRVFDKSATIFSGFDGPELASQVSGICSDLKFVVGLKKKYEKKYKAGKYRI